VRLARLPPVGFASLIVADFPALFAEFRGKRFTLLWRGSRDGFGARDFHGRCDGHAPTLTLIQDTEGNIFGGFTPVEWESRTGDFHECFEADPSLESFPFPLKNPHNFPVRKFALKAERDWAICCDSWRGPHFWDMGVSDNCNANTHSFSHLDLSYANGTVLAGETVLTGSFQFRVKEIEVFEIIDEMALPNPAHLPWKSRFARNAKKVANHLFTQHHFLKETDQGCVNCMFLDPQL
jgi:hypothetical protein